MQMEIELSYDMSYEEQTKLANIFGRQVKDGNHGSYIADLGQELDLIV